MSGKLRGNLMLLLTALIWGTAFVAQRVGMDYVGPFTFNGLRSILAGIALLPVVAIMHRRNGQKPQGPKLRTTWVGGFCCGLALFAASAFQQFGMVEADAGKAGFITALYIVIVPLLGIFLRKRVGVLTWVAVLVAAVGLYLLCVKDSVQMERGDLLVLCSALLFAVHILVIDYFSPRADCVMMSCIQFFVCGALALCGMALFESPSVPAILNGWLPILYAGLLSSAVGYTLQIVAQRDTNPVVASLLMSLESVFAAVAGWLLLGETLTARELLGAGLMFAAIVLAQVVPAGRGAVDRPADAG